MFAHSLIALWLSSVALSALAAIGPRPGPVAKSGAACSNNLTRPSRSVFETQLPLYLAEMANGSLELRPEETIYTLCIGANDVGLNELLQGKQAPGMTIVDVVACAMNWNFMFQNMIPLELVPLHVANAYPNRYWTAQRNTTEWSVCRNELTTSGNAIAELMLQALAPTLHGAHLALFDSHSLLADIDNRPHLYLNGTAPQQSTGDAGECTDTVGTDQNRFDELHPSMQAERVVAQDMSDVKHRRTEKWNTGGRRSGTQEDGRLAYPEDTCWT
ncbi:hypothetical protein C8Q74DRAFT_1454826 [Fomes fomentarius]|nr:hypothetical protein C8Q74DRAFT_1454826 [Fomes fomentarius]